MLERIEALIEKATPGPWENNAASGMHEHYQIAWVGARSIDGSTSFPSTRSGENADAAFIAHARQLLPLMLRVCQATKQIVEADHILDNPAASKADQVHFSMVQTEGIMLAAEDLEKVYAYCANLPEEEK